jgi:hypothetical protein
MDKLELMQKFIEGVIEAEYDKFLEEQGCQHSPEIAEAFCTGYSKGMIAMQKLIEQKIIIVKGE